MGEEHFDFTPGAPRSNEGIRLCYVASEFPRALMDRTGNVSVGRSRATPELQFAFFAVGFGGPVTNGLIVLHIGADGLEFPACRQQLLASRT